MIEHVRDLRVINVLAKFENGAWKIMDARVLTGLVCQYPGALQGCGVKMEIHDFEMFSEKSNSVLQILNFKGHTFNPREQHFKHNIYKIAYVQV